MSKPIPLEDLVARLTKTQRLMGLDLGTKTIGVAVSDVSRALASPVETVKRVKFTQDAQALLVHVKRYDVGGFIIGLPINMDGSEGPRAQATRSFIRSMATITDLPFATWDERLSTVAAERTLIEADWSRRKRAEAIDAHAAAFILQGALDRLTVMGRAADEARQRGAGV